MFDLGAQELIVIFVVAFLVFGPKRLPELGRTLGKGIRELKSAMRNMRDSIEESELNVSKEIKEATSGIKEAIDPDIINKSTESAKKEREEPVNDKQHPVTGEDSKGKSETDRDG